MIVLFTTLIKNHTLNFHYFNTHKVSTFQVRKYVSNNNNKIVTFFLLRIIRSEINCIHLHMNVTGKKCGNYIAAQKVFDKMSMRNLYSWNNMLSGYAKLRLMKQARSLFDQMQEKDIVSWNTMTIGYAQNGQFDEAVKSYKELRNINIRLNEFSFAGVLTVCATTKELKLTKQLHCQVFDVGFLSYMVLCSKIIDCYAKCGDIKNARKLFDEMPKKDVLAWTTIVSGYAMLGDMNSARELFNEMPEKNPVSWNALISGYSRNGFGYESLELFTEMLAQKVKPDQFTFSSALCACASIASIKNGKQIHGLLIKTLFTPNTIVISSLIDMYSKCGNIELGQIVFKFIGDKSNTVLWNTMISSLAQHGHGASALNIFSNMVKSQVKLDRITFVVILNACSHSGLVDNGLHIFNTMINEHNIIPDQEHYACLIDLLGRAECFDEVVNHIRKMPIKPDERVWKALLGTCKIHGNIELGIKAAERLIELEPKSSVGYVYLSSIYAASRKWESVAKVRRLMNERDVKKELGVSWLENENKLHAFTVSDESHSSKDDIESVLGILTFQMVDDDFIHDI